MSGIAALIGFDGPHPQLPDIAAMTDAMRHRGPDGIRHRMAGMAAFGATFFGGTRPPRDVVVEELTQATLHGFLHRS